MGDLLTLTLAAAWLMLPAYAANMAPVLAARWKFAEHLAFPVDGGLMFGGRRLLGSHKTFRGFVFGIIAATGIVWLQAELYSFGPFSDISLIFYPGINIARYGLLLGFGALFGDAVKSFFKRRVGIPAGKGWPFFDQIDFAVGALAFLAFVFRPPFAVIVLALAISPVLHFLVDMAGRRTGIKR